MRRRVADGLAGVPPWSIAVSAMLAIQLSNALSVSVVNHVGPAGTAWLRMSFGVVFLWMFSRPAIRSLRRRDLPSLLALGVATGFMTTLFLAAVERIPLGTTVAIEFLGPLVVAGVMSKQRKALVWPLLAFIGVVLLTEPWHGSIDLVGVGFALAAGACWGLYNVLTQHVGDRFSGISGLSLTIPIAALATLPFGLPQVLGGSLDWWVLPMAAGIALITPVIAFGLEMLALRRMTHTAFGTLLSIEPAFGVLIGLLVLAQSPGVMQLVGVALVVLAGTAAQQGGKRTPKPLMTTDVPATPGP
ncbi:EamA family transporter [Paenarthrobacter ureafaciens]|uniref:EamA family transporter n=1 Tax=Paenarthrobacter ureafaciens TaxID=37931 RepID=UPI00211930E2|nr:EamA family transporter [Paenarthrobacter ureafaciens]MEC3851563.1 EamA family transporter [Paenarthrobacter ureafaciens]NWL27514.1 EamA family transporter [Paenarthrobacter ureafaciens]